MNRTFLIWLCVVLLIAFAFALTAPAMGEDFNPNATAVWRGTVYTPASFPRGTWCGQNGGCPMCESLRAQWRSWEPVTVKVQDDDEYETRYRTEIVKETRYRQRKVCEPVYGPFGRQIGSQCRYVNEPYTVNVEKKVAYKVRKAPKPVPEVPAIALKTEVTVLPTPAGAIRRLFDKLRPKERMTIIDAGSGDGRVLIEASRVGYRAIGVEIERQNVEVSRKAIRESGFPAIVHEGDATTFDYSEADLVYVYQFPDVQRKIIRRLRPGTKVISYQHPIEGVKCTEFDAGGGAVFYIGEIGKVETQSLAAKSTGTTFGL